MFELIRANRRKSMVLIFLMLALLMCIGFIIGSVVYPAGGPSQTVFIPIGGLVGMGIAFLIWGGQALAAYSSGERLLMAAAGAREIKKQDHPRLFNIVEEMTIAARLPAMPKVYIIEDMSLNAFAAGRDPNHAAVAVTQGLLGKLNRDQLQGVIAHEVAHIANRDVLFMTFAGIMLGSIIMITEVFLRMMWYSNLGGSRRYSSSRGSSGKNEGAARAIMLVIALVLAIVAPLLAQILYFACSRQREYLADAGGAVYTRYPEGLASALEAIAKNPGDKESVSKAMAPMYIINPLESGTRSLSSLTSTHPPIEERVRILRAMGGGASLNAYAAAASKISGKSAVHIPESALAAEKAAARQASPPTPGIASAAGAMAAVSTPPGMARAASPPEPDPRQRHREAGDLVRRMHQFRFIECSCGLRIKIPPEYAKSQVKCPRCSKVHTIS